jgi:hypothetical protein
MTEFAEAYVAQWERVATIRSAKRYVVPEGAAPASLYPAVLEPLFCHPEVAALSQQAREFIAVQACYQFMNNIALLETDVVGQLASDLANRPHRVPVSRAMRQAALTVTVDEAYHAFAAREYMEQVERVTGIAPLALSSDCHYASLVPRVRARVPAELHDDFHVMALCMAENSITAEVLGITQGTPPDNPFHIVTDEHLQDERRHAGFFQSLLKRYWAGLDADAHEALGAVLPAYFGTFLEIEPWMDPAIARLRGAGMKADDAARIARHVFGYEYPPAEHPMARNIIRMLERAGVLQHEPTRAGLVKAGWMSAEA